MASTRLQESRDEARVNGVIGNNEIELATNPTFRNNVRPSSV
jgi:hypothetical protein